MNIFHSETREELERLQLFALALFLALFFTVSALTPYNAPVNADEPGLTVSAITAEPSDSGK